MLALKLASVVSHFVLSLPPTFGAAIARTALDSLQRYFFTTTCAITSRYDHDLLTSLGLKKNLGCPHHRTVQRSSRLGTLTSSILCADQPDPTSGEPFLPT